MLFTTNSGNESVSLQFTAPTVVEPGEKIKATLVLTVKSKIDFQYMGWEFPDSINLEEIEGLEKSRTFEPGDTFEYVVIFGTDKYSEDYGLIKAAFVYSIGSEKVELSFEAWISIFKRVKAAVEELSLELRKRLIEVVNFRIRNGHIFLADYNAFFDHFLNIEVPDSVREFLAEEFGLPNEGLPVDPETYLLIIGGLISFYGIERLELIAEEDCNESDDRFDLYAVREVDQNVI